MDRRPFYWQLKSGKPKATSLFFVRFRRPDGRKRVTAVETQKSGGKEPPLLYRSSGVSPVRLAILASIRGPISSWS